MILPCDIRIASEGAKFSFPFLRIGVAQEMGSSYLLPRIIGLGRASELILTGRTIDAREAKEIGLVDELGDLPDAIEKAGRLGGIKGKVEAVYPEKEGFSLLRFLLGQDTEESLTSWLSLAYPEPAFLPTWFK